MCWGLGYWVGIKGIYYTGIIVIFRDCTPVLSTNHSKPSRAQGVRPQV